MRDLTVKYLEVVGAREHNLKGVDVRIPRNTFTVITGLSGSGKSSLAFDTIFAEGQRRYVESLSAYARQFLGQMKKPEVDYIEGLSPAISIDQKALSRNPRSTVGTVTEIFDYFRLLWANIGIPHCPKCGKRIERQSAEQIVSAVRHDFDGDRIQVLAPVVDDRKGHHKVLFDQLRRDGYIRVRVDGEEHRLDEEDAIELDKNYKHTIEVVVDRLELKGDVRQRLDAIAYSRGRTAPGSWRRVVCCDPPCRRDRPAWRHSGWPSGRGCGCDPGVPGSCPR